MAPVKTIRNILMELRKICQHPYLSEPDLEPLEATEEEQQRQLIHSSGKLQFLKLLLPKLKERGHRVLLFSQFKIALDRIEDFLYGEGVKFLRLDGDVQQAQRQKSMDLFNAPNSDYDVFLLTTRAGGVGINLATADTVIIYDPDFNPHQDLQAIARSHRYGQKKKVLVFKLMVKGSVEENIINKGKKKMVLDHLVVQQMGKENEEGDIDDLLLRGAEAIYSNEGMNVPDILYNSKNVDELIDKVEADADAEAKEAEERETRIQNGEAEPAESSRSAMQFGFAKIWEGDQLRATAEEEEDVGERAETNWEEILQNMQNEKQLKATAQIEGQRARRLRRAAAQQYTIDGSLDEASPERTKSKHKGKGKAVDGGNGSSSDAEYTVLPGEAASDDEVSISSVPEGFGGLTTEDERRPLPGGLAGVQKMTKKEKRMFDAAKALRDAGLSDSATVPLPLPASHSALLPNGRLASGQKRGHSNTEDGTARKRRRRDVYPEGYHGSSGGVDDQIAEGQRVLALLYSVLREFKAAKDMRRWGLMALPEVASQERGRRYVQLAKDTDDKLEALGQSRYFLLNQQLNVVMALFVARAPAISDAPSRPPPMPDMAGVEIDPPSQVPVGVAAPDVPRPPPPQTIPLGHQAVSTQTNGLGHQPNGGAGLHNESANPAPLLCEFCGRQHNTVDCGDLPTIADLETVIDTIWTRKDSVAQKGASLNQLRSTCDLMVKLGRLPSSLAAVLSSNVGITAGPGSSHHYVSTGPNQLYVQHTCPFCNMLCGKDIKTCVDAHGGRKKLKEKIRDLEQMIQAGDGRRQVKERQMKLYDAYKAWPRS